MENIDFSQTVNQGTVSMMMAGVILVLSVLIVLIIITAKRWKGRVIPMLLGLLAYVVFGFMFSQMFMSVIRLIPSVDQAFTYNSSSYIVIFFSFKPYHEITIIQPNISYIIYNKSLIHIIIFPPIYQHL